MSSLFWQKKCVIPAASSAGECENENLSVCLSVQTDALIFLRTRNGHISPGGTKKGISRQAVIVFSCALRAQRIRLSMKPCLESGSPICYFFPDRLCGKKLRTVHFWVTCVTRWNRYRVELPSCRLLAVKVILDANFRGLLVSRPARCRSSGARRRGAAAMRRPCPSKQARNNLTENNYFCLS